MSGVDKFSGSGQGKYIMLLFPKEKISTINKEKVELSGKFTPSEEIEKVTNLKNDM